MEYQRSDKRIAVRLIFLFPLFLFLILLENFTGCGGQSSSSPPSPGVPAITAQPANQTVTVGLAATFGVAAIGTQPLRYQWQKNGADIPGATSERYTTPSTTTADSGSQFRVLVSNAAGSVTSSAAILTVTSDSPAGVDVTSYHYDNARTGQNLNERTLTLTAVASGRFAKVGSFLVDGKVDAQPLLVSAVVIPNAGTHNILYVATEHGTVYAYDADNTSAPTMYWTASVLAGESPNSEPRCGQVSPEIGVTATPVIDRTRGPNGAIYLVATSKDASGNVHHRLHALDLTTGRELFGGPATITATYPGSGDNSSGGQVVFDPRQYKERPGLTLVNGNIFTMWASHCDIGPYTSWVIAFDANTLARTAVLNLVPNGSGGAIWISGTAPAADASGNLYVMLGNGDFDTLLNASQFPSNVSAL